MIRKTKGGYKLMSHKGKSLGKFKTKKAAMKRERQVNYFKNKDK